MEADEKFAASLWLMFRAEGAARILLLTGPPLGNESSRTLQTPRLFNTWQQLQAARVK
jgi:hypothetical protein